MPKLTEAALEDRLVHYTRHLRKRIALCLKLRAALPDGHHGIIAEETRRANLEGVLIDLTDILNGDVPRYTTDEEL